MRKMDGMLLWLLSISLIPLVAAQPVVSPSSSLALDKTVILKPFGHVECTGACLTSEKEQRQNKEFLIYEALPEDARKKGETYCRSQGPEYQLIPIDPKAACNQAEALGECMVEGVSENLKYVRCAMKCAISCQYTPPAEKNRDSGFKKARPKKPERKPKRAADLRGAVVVDTLVPYAVNPVLSERAGEHEALSAIEPSPREERRSSAAADANEATGL